MIHALTAKTEKRMGGERVEKRGHNCRKGQKTAGKRVLAELVFRTGGNFFRKLTKGKRKRRGRKTSKRRDEPLSGNKNGSQGEIVGEKEEANERNL